MSTQTLAINKNLASLTKRIRAQEKQIIAKGFTVVDTEHVTKKGIVFPVELNTSVFEYDDKESVLIISKDISDRKTYQEQLEQERDLFQTLMDNIPDRIYFKDVNSKFTLINKAQISWSFE